MTSLVQFFQLLKPTLDKFLHTPTLQNLMDFEKVLYGFNWTETKIAPVHVLVPLALKLEELNGKEQELRTGILTCIRIILSNSYLKDLKSLNSILAITIKQIRNFESAKSLINLSEEIKWTAVLCIKEAMKHSTTDVLEEFYTKNSSNLLGHILLLLVEMIEQEHYRNLVKSSIECLMVAFYVHDEANATDVSLRNQVADSLFIFLPKVVSVLFKTSISDEKIGESIKCISITALGRILNVIYEDTIEYNAKKKYDNKEFKKLISRLKSENLENEKLILESSNIAKNRVEEHMKRIQAKGRSSQWFEETSKRINAVLKKMCILRSHTSNNIRQEYANLSCCLLKNCTQNLKENFFILLENIIALSEDKDDNVRLNCQNMLTQIQGQAYALSIFDETADLLFEEHTTNFISILQRKEENELYAELLFLKGFLKNLDSTKLTTLFSLTNYLEKFCLALVNAVDLEITRELLNEEYTLRKLDENEYNECAKLHWRHYKYLDSKRCIGTLQDICEILGGTNYVNRLIFDHLIELYKVRQNRMNELLVILVWMFAIPPTKRQKNEHVEKHILNALVHQILEDFHWHLALCADDVKHLTIYKPSYWFVDRTPGLYESGIEVRIQDYDSDDEDMDGSEEQTQRVTISDAQFNILHTCVILDTLGHCALSLEYSFSPHIFYSLHKVLLKVASSNTMIYEAALFALVSMQQATGYEKISNFIEAHTDYLSYHLNTLLKRTPESSSAVEILSVILQLSTRNSLPHLENIFSTIREECSKCQQQLNILSYLKVFNAFLINVKRWQDDCKDEVEMLTETTEIIDDDYSNYENILKNWLQILKNTISPINTNHEFENISNSKTNENNLDNNVDTNCDKEIINKLPRYIEIVKEVLQQVLNFISTNNQAQQIQSLECFIVGIPLLRDYENELLPLVHKLWRPLIEKFRQRNPIVLNRCFTLLNILSTNAKEFILKRSLDDIIPYLQSFLKEASLESGSEHQKAQTQTYKLQLKLLKEFCNIIRNMQIDGKSLNDIAEVVVLYLSKIQPKELQTQSVNFFLNLHRYNGPLIYLVVMKKSHLHDYKENVGKILQALKM